jgi:HEPN domain-containing protein
MKPAEEVKREFVRQWLSRANADLLVSRHLLEEGNQVLAIVGFPRAAGSGKGAQALLVWHQIEFPKTHDIGRLVELIAGFDASLAAHLQAASSLTPYGAQHRYPGDLPEPSVADAERAVQLAVTVWNKVVERLPAEFRIQGPEK